METAGKNPARSKTLWFNFLGFIVFGLLKAVAPEFAEAICGNEELTFTIGLVLVQVVCLVNILLRFMTKEKVGLGLLLLLLANCASTNQVLEPGVFYKRDVGIEVNGRLYEGVVTVPYAKQYQFVLAPKGSIDLMLIKTCHRTYSAEKLSSGWFGKNKFSYLYTPMEGIEDSRVCPIRLDVFESAKEARHSWAFIDFENPKYTVQASLTCDGSVRRVNGVGVCQAKSQTVQKIFFSEPMRFAPAMPDTCAKPIQKDQNSLEYEIEATVGECLYHFDTQDGRLGRLTMVGYQGVLIREAQ